MATRRAVWTSVFAVIFGSFGCGANDTVTEENSVFDATTSASVQEALTAPSICLLDAPRLLPRVDATASSVEAPSLAPGFAIDNDPNTRWSSAFSDPQWLRIDLGAVRYIDSVSLRWEKASSFRYEIQISNDGNSWKALRAINYNSPGPQELSFPQLNARGRYVRIYSYARTTEWGVSLYDVSVYGDLNGGCTQPGAVRIDAGHSGRSLDVTDWSTADGGRIQQWGYGGGNNQKWILTGMGTGLYEIKSLHSGKCLDVSDNSTQNGAALQQWTCTSGQNQRFTLKPVGNGQYQIVAAHSGKCLDVSGGSTANGARVIQWPCHTGDNQKWSFIDPQDTQTDPNNCGRPGHSCFGGACIAGVCQAALVTTAFQCATSMTATDQHIYVGDVGNLQRYDVSGYNKTTVVTGNNDYIADLVRSGSQLFWQNGTSIRRLNAGQTNPTTIYTGGVGQLSVTGATVVGYDFSNARFISVDRNLTSPGPFNIITELGSQYPMLSAATSTHLFYVYGTSEGTSVFQVERATGQKRLLNDSTESIFGMTAFGETAYWTYRTTAGQAGIRRLSSAPGAVIEEAVPPAHQFNSVGNALVDASGIYHSFYDGTNNFYYRTPHTNPNVRELVSNGYLFPYQSTNATLTSDSIIWLSTCHRHGGGFLYRLAKP